MLSGRVRRFILTAPSLLALIVWGAAAIWFDGPASRPLAGALSAGFAISSIAAFMALRPFRKGLTLFCLLFIVVLSWWLTISPSNQRDWQSDVAHLPTARIEGERVTISNLRNFDYRSETDYTERWEERTYNLGELRGADIFLSYWGSPMIAHTIVSWEFAGGQHLAISIETRKQKGEAYSTVRGFFRQFELYYVVADERDVVRLRTNYRGEDVYLYRLSVPTAQTRAVLLDYLAELNQLALEPSWYNALIHNCTTTIRHHIQQVAPDNPFNWKILINGYIDELGYSRGTIDTSLPFDELRRRSNITQRARAFDRDPGFSARIREGLPGFPRDRNTDQER